MALSPEKERTLSQAEANLPDKIFLRITLPANFSNPNKLNLDDIMGQEFNDYYDGFGFDHQTKDKDFFFYNVPANLIELVAPRLECYPQIKIFHRKMTSN